MGNYVTQDDLELVTNGATRVPVVLCLDVSGSMSPCINDLNEGVAAFYDAIRSDPTAREACEIAIVTFNSSVEVAEDFQSVQHKQNPTFTAYGGTDMTGGIQKALELLETRKQKYKDTGTDYFQPWLVIMSDGEPNDINSVRTLQEKTKKMEEDKKLVVFGIFIGNDSGKETLAGFSKRGAMSLKGTNFVEFFQWLGRSVSIVGKSQKDEAVSLDQDVGGWLKIGL